MVIHLFGDKLRELRKENNMTQKDIANMFNIKEATVSAWEVGKAQPSIDTIIVLAQYFNVSTDYLLGFNQNDLNKMDKLKIACQENGILVGQDFTIEEFEKAMSIVEMLKEKK